MSSDNINGRKNLKRGYRYNYDEAVKAYFEKRLQYFKDKEKLDKKKFAMVTTRDQLEYEKDVKKDATKQGSLRQDKKRLLDYHIFPSMANLLVFFEYLAKYPELRKDFEDEDDVKELFGYIKEPWDRNKENESEYNVRNGIVRRLVSSLFTWDWKKDPNNFRLDLIGDLQYELWRIITGLARKDFGGGFGVNKIVNTDMGRAVTWAKLYASKYNDSDQKKNDIKKTPKRPISF